jgi:uncharacterized membrane protein
MEREPWDTRLAAIEERLTRLEALLADRTVGGNAQPGTDTPWASAPSPQGAGGGRYGPLPGAARSTAVSPARPGASLATLLLGWGGALALVLAAAYLIRLAIESGWLTPARQLLMAVAVAFGMIVAGFRLRAMDGRYAGFLPAGGVVILFLSVYGAHHVFSLMGHGPAAVAVMLICFGSLWLGRSFASDLYAFFAVVGSYAVPVLMDSPPSTLELAGYFMAWATVFAGFSLWQARRQIYLLATVLGALVLVWCFDGRPEEWQSHSLLQAAHWWLLWSASLAISRRTGKSMTLRESVRHATALWLVYGIQFLLWDDHAPGSMVWILLAPVVLFAAMHGVERRWCGDHAEGSQALLWWWVALWAVHALYHETLSPAWQPWLACAALPLAAVALRVSGARAVVLAPLLGAASLLYALLLGQLLAEDVSTSTPLQALLLPLLALQGWGVWWAVQRTGRVAALQWAGLIAGHVAAMGAVLDLVNVPIAQSALWALLALGWIAVSRQVGQLRPAQSALPVFALAAGKVLLFDLSDAAPLARIASLAVIGVSFYAGGLFYQRSAAASRDAPGA